MTYAPAARVTRLRASLGVYNLEGLRYSSPNDERTNDMATPILTLKLSDDENSIFVYAGGISVTDDLSRAPHIHDDEQLLACIGRQDPDLEQKLAVYVRDALESCG